jgi:putative transcriptional regulator
MHNLNRIRDHLGITQQALAQELGCRLAHEGGKKGRALPLGAAATPFALSAGQGLAIGFDHIDGAAPLSGLPTRGEPMTVVHGAAPLGGGMRAAPAPAWPVFLRCPRSHMASDCRTGRTGEPRALAFQKGQP